MIREIFYSFRPKQWTKNLFIFSALIFDRQLTNSNSFFTTLAGFLIFCALSSSVYLFNDLFDFESDKNHPTKKNRPIASGRLNKRLAIVIATFLGIGAHYFAFLLSLDFFLICLSYSLINLLYSKWLKHLPIIDVLIVASGFVLRVAAGVMLVEVERFSPWLYVVTTLLALFIGFGKRRAELALLAGSANQHRTVFEGYSLDFLDQLITIVSGTTIIGYSLYTFSAPNLPTNHAMMLTIPFVLYGIFRYLYLIKVKESGGAPEELLMTDRPLQVVILLWGISVLIIFYLT